MNFREVITQYAEKIILEYKKNNDDKLKAEIDWTNSVLTKAAICERGGLTDQDILDIASFIKPIKEVKKPVKKEIKKTVKKSAKKDK